MSVVLGYDYAGRSASNNKPRANSPMESIMTSTSESVDTKPLKSQSTEELARRNAAIAEALAGILKSPGTLPTVIFIPGRPLLILDWSGSVTQPGHTDLDTPATRVALKGEQAPADGDGDKQSPLSEAAPHIEETAAASTSSAEKSPDLSPRQQAMLGALHSKMDESKQVSVKAAALATAAQIPMGSVHSVLQSLEKKRLIKTTRPGSARLPASYQIL